MTPEHTEATLKSSALMCTISSTLDYYSKVAGTLNAIHLLRILNLLVQSNRASSPVLSRHHWIIDRKVAGHFKVSRFMLYRWNHLIKPVVNISSVIEPVTGQRLTSRWEQKAISTDLVYKLPLQGLLHKEMVTYSRLINKILPCSAIKIKRSPTLLYSVWDLDTNSDSFSANQKAYD